MRLTITLLALLVACSAAADDHGELLNQEERAWLESLSEPLIIGTETHYHPYNFLDEDGELSGVLGDYARLFEERLGIRFATKAYATFPEVLEAARNREVDIVPLIVAAPERTGYLDFTQPMYSTRDYIFTRQDYLENLSLDTMDGLKLGIIEGYALHTELIRDYPDIELVPMVDEPQAFLALSLGSIDVYISEIGVASWYIETEAITNLRIAGQLDRLDPQSVGTRSDWPILNRIIGKALASVSPEEHQAIQRRWISLEGIDPAELQRVWRKVGIAAAVIGLALAAILTWSFSLQREVAKRTSELRQELLERRAVEADKLRLAVAVEQTVEFVLLVDTAGGIEYANRAFEEACGIGPVAGQALDSLAQGTSHETLGTLLQVARETGSWRGKIRLVGCGDMTPKVEMTIAPIFNIDGNIDGYVATGRDVTNEEQFEARLQRSERLSALGTLAGGIAHDFNNLLVPIMGYTDILRAESPEEHWPHLDGIERASERARNLVERIMVFGRGETGELESLNIRFEIDDAITFVRSLLPSTIKVETDLRDSGTVLGDRTQVQQILLNLSTNANDAMGDKGGTLSFRLEPVTVAAAENGNHADVAPGQYALLTVADTGIGMDRQTQERIFDPYFTDKLEAEGTGLGLAIVHGAVARHGGAIEVDSAPGTGTTFRIYLPVIAKESVSADAVPDIRATEGGGQSILLVDDDNLVLRTLEKMLQRLGYKVSAFADPIAARSAFAENPAAFDMVLSDLTMPELSGMQLAQQLLAIRSDIPIALITGNPGTLKDYEGVVISKPVQLGELAEHVEALLAG